MVFRGVHVVSDNHNFVTQQSPGNGYGYGAYGELSNFVYCFLQKTKETESLPLVDKWENYMLPSHSALAPLKRSNFWWGNCVHAGLEKISSSYMENEFRPNARRFHEKFCSTILSTIATRSMLGQGGSWLCLEVIIGGDDYFAIFLFGQLLDGLVERG